MDNRISLQLMLDATGHVTSYATVGGLTGATTYEGEIPDEFLTSTQPQAFKLIDNVLTKDPNYAPSVQPVVENQPSDEQRFQAQLALQMATMQKKQAEFNAQVLLQLADTKETVTPAAPVTEVTPVTSEAPAASEAPVTSEASKTPVTSEIVKTE
ncbi:hypothetical protein IMAU80162_00670 [Lactiplantibacillus plantarum]|uniref:DUF2977 domain-containing protein n=1 Tax=Lactiplantibacillus plantarum TaxID=1590 RepID=UPI003853F4C2|nr:hypothetical protein [Lactiplantibacillus plantarum]MCG0864537.1 hypothetical protein [Lactiplantibacillus plantarum]